MIEWGWRIEGRRMILYGSESDASHWPRALTWLMRGSVATITALGRLPEIGIELSTGVHIVSLIGVMLWTGSAPVSSVRPSWGATVKEPDMPPIGVVGVDIAKSVFQVHAIDGDGVAVVRRKLRRGEVMRFFERLSPCLVGMEACASAHYWARQIAALGHQVRLMPAA
jgi:hypothetical protein